MKLEMKAGEIVHSYTYCAVPDCGKKATRAADISINNAPKKHLPVCKAHDDAAKEDFCVVWTWWPVTVPVPPELVNDPNSITGELKMLLLAIPDNEHYPNAIRGWYYGGLLNEFRQDGSPGAVKPSHWMPLPPKPKP